MYVAIQQIKGVQPTVFMKLATPMSLEDLKECCGKRLPLDGDWMRANGFKDVNGWATSVVTDVKDDGEAHGVLLLKTANSLYQAIPDFND